MGRSPASRVSRTSAHRQLRRAVALEIAAGGVRCWRCGAAIHPAEPWDLGHDDNDRSVYRGPEHQSCNRSAGGKQAAKMVGRRTDHEDPPPPSGW